MKVSCLCFEECFIARPGGGCFGHIYIYIFFFLE